MNVKDRLQAEGPLTSGEIRVQTQDRHRHDVRKMRVSGSKSCKPIGNHKTLYYLPEHDAETVVRAYLEKNGDILRRKKRFITRFFNKYGSKFGDAWRDISHEYDVQVTQPVSDGGYVEDRTCPLCDESIDKLATHLPDCQHG